MSSGSSETVHTNLQSTNWIFCSVHQIPFRYIGIAHKIVWTSEYSVRSTKCPPAWEKLRTKSFFSAEYSVLHQMSSRSRQSVHKTSRIIGCRVVCDRNIGGDSCNFAPLPGFAFLLNRLHTFAWGVKSSGWGTSQLLSQWPASWLLYFRGAQMPVSMCVHIPQLIFVIAWIYSLIDSKHKFQFKQSTHKFIWNQKWRNKVLDLGSISGGVQHVSMETQSSGWNTEHMGSSRTKQTTWKSARFLKLVTFFQHTCTPANPLANCVRTQNPWSSGLILCILRLLSTLIFSPAYKFLASVILSHRCKPTWSLITFVLEETFTHFCSFDSVELAPGEGTFYHCYAAPNRIIVQEMNTLCVGPTGPVPCPAELKATRKMTNVEDNYERKVGRFTYRVLTQDPHNIAQCIYTHMKEKASETCNIFE